MQIFIQNITTGQFFAGNNKWCSEAEKAYAFPNSLAAMNFCHIQRNSRDLMMHFQTPFGMGLKIANAMQEEDNVASMALWKGPTAFAPGAVPSSREK